MARRSALARRTYQDTLKRVLALPARDQLALYEDLRRHLGVEVGQETEDDRQSRQRLDALKAMAQAATRLDLPGNQAPQVREFDRAHRELGTDWRSHRVTAAWGRYSTAKAAYRGDHVALSPAQRSMLRSVAGRRTDDRKHEEPIAGLRTWLGTKPASTGRKDYQEFRAEYNDRLPDGSRPLAMAATITNQTGLRWPTLLSIAKGELTAEEAREREAGEGSDAPWGELVGGREAAALIGVGYGRHQQLARNRDFPLPAAHLGNWRLWRRADIEAYARGDRDDYETTVENELQGDVIGKHQLADRLGIRYDLLTDRISRRRWHLVPKPTGRIGDRFSYWSLGDVERWEREERREPRRGKRSSP